MALVHPRALKRDTSAHTSYCLILSRVPSSEFLGIPSYRAKKIKSKKNKHEAGPPGIPLGLLLPPPPPPGDSPVVEPELLSIGGGEPSRLSRLSPTEGARAMLRGAMMTTLLLVAALLQTPATAFAYSTCYPRGCLQNVF